MKETLYKEMYRQEQTYWWHVAKRRLVQEAIQRDVADLSRKKILDVGCGTGAMISELASLTSRVYGVDGARLSFKYCRQRGLVNIRQYDFEKGLPYPNQSFDIIVCLDVLEHVQKDQEFIGEFYRVLKKGGKLFLTVPAYQSLWTYWDEMLGHKRRYRRSNLLQILKKVGFRTQFDSYFYSFLVPVAIVFRSLKTILDNRASDFVDVPDGINRLLLLLCSLERRLFFRLNIPFGLSIFVQTKR